MLAGLMTLWPHVLMARTTKRSYQRVLNYSEISLSAFAQTKK
jgi:hypothetical protein